MARTRQAPFLAAALILVFGGGAWLLFRNAGRTSELEQAEQAIAKRDFRTARGHLDKHLAEFPHDADALLLAARTARRDDDLTSAASRLSEYEKIVGRTELSDFERDLLILHRGNRQMAAKGLAFCRAEPASSQCDLALEAIMETTLNSFTGPFEYHNPIPAQDLTDTAMPNAREAIEIWFARPISPADRTQGHIWRARLREISGEHTAAIADLRAALEIAPEHDHASYLLAMFRLQESPGESQTILKRLCDRKPGNTGFALSYAEALRFGGRIDESRAVLDRLLESVPNSGPALLARGRVALDLQNPGDAERFLRLALDASPNSQDAHAAMARCMRLLGRLDEAAKHQERQFQIERERQSPK